MQRTTFSGKRNIDRIRVNIKITPDRRQSKTLKTIDKRGWKIARNSVFYCHFSPVGRQMAIKNSVSNVFWSTFVDSINAFDCRLPGVKMSYYFFCVRANSDGSGETARICRHARAFTRIAHDNHSIWAGSYFHFNHLQQTDSLKYTLNLVETSYISISISINDVRFYYCRFFWCSV